jgi:mitotic spindle assembly checkpoint protein MAD2
MEKEIKKTSSKTSTTKEKRPKDKEKSKDKAKDKDDSKVHKLSLKGSSKLVAEFVCLLSNFSHDFSFQLAQMCSC